MRTVAVYGETLRALRLAAGFNQVELGRETAAAMGRTPAAMQVWVSRVERANVKVVRVETAEALATALGVPLVALCRVPPLSGGEDGDGDGENHPRVEGLVVSTGQVIPLRRVRERKRAEAEA